MGLKGLGAHRWGKGKRGKDIWDRKNLIHGRKGGCYALCVRRESRWETAWTSWIGQDWRAWADKLKGPVLNPKTLRNH